MQPPELQSLPVGKLQIDREVQRGLDRRWANTLAENLDLNILAARPLVISHRRSAIHIIIDGQHRKEAVVMRFGVDHEVPCLIYRGLTKQQEATLFREANAGRKVQAVDLFLVRVTEEDPVAMAISDILGSHGWRVYNGSHVDGHFAAVLSMERCYRKDPLVAEQTIAVLTRAWGYTNGTMDAKMVEGIFRVLLRYGPEINRDRLAEKISRYPGGPIGLLSKAKGLRDMKGGNVPDAVAEIVVNQYNSRARVGALSPWNGSAA